MFEVWHLHMLWCFHGFENYNQSVQYMKELKQLTMKKIRYGGLCNIDRYKENADKL